MPPEKKKLFQLVNMLYMKPINENVQYHEVQITNIFLKGYPFSCNLEQFKSRIYGCEVS